MMQMLAAGGMPLLFDDLRPPDEHNLRGYYEDRRVKSLAADNTWVHGADGKAIKVVSLLLYELPSDLEYRVLFMRRDLDEVLRSQEQMLAGTPAENQAPSMPQLRRHFERHLESLTEWLERQTHIRVMDVQHRALIESPNEAALSVAQFLQCGLDVDAMAAVVDPSLYRQR